MRTEDMYYNEQKCSEVMEVARRLRRRFLRYQQAGASNYYQNVLKTLTKQLLIYAEEHDTASFSMDFRLEFLEEHYSMSSKIEQKKWRVAIHAASMRWSSTSVQER